MRRGDVEATPICRTLSVRCRWGAGSYSWPSTVEVKAGGRTSRLRIANATRRAQVAVVLGVLFGTLAIARAMLRRSRSGR
jgi:hypothetical protein